jgi:EAL domain-containing protein (putative c-di-GMP-specific phosphodiesterase class I)/GGDEF domain-containing protein
MNNKILIVTDDSGLDDFLRTELCTGLSCALLGPSEDPIQKVFDEVPHLILIDEDFRNGEGRAVARRVKEDLVLKHIPIILLVNKHEMLLREKTSHIDVYFRKGEDPKRLVTLVKEILTENYDELDLNPVTHLPGSRSSVLRMERAIRSKSLFNICCVDLSNLRAYNGAYGETKGDRIVARLGQILKAVLKKEGERDDFLGHLGGDDFVVVTRSGNAVAISEAIIKQFDGVVPSFYKPADRKQGYVLQKGENGFLVKYPMISISVAIIDMEHMPLSDISQIGQVAARLKKYTKTLPPGSCYIKYLYRPDSVLRNGRKKPLEVRFPGRMKSVRVSERSEYQRKSADALFESIAKKKKKINTVYQPIVDLKTRKIVAYEALTRCPATIFSGDIGAFFDAARQSGRIKDIDRLCVEMALKNAQSLPPGKKLFLNLSHETLIDQDSMKDIFAARGKIGLENLVVEVTEQGILRSFDKIRDALLDLKQKGLMVAIDDLGGGAVSLRDVAVLKPDFVKFDRSLIRQIDANVTKQQIVLSMILFCNGIRAMTTAEGIETRREYQTVLMCGITLGQGYYFSKPTKPFLQSIVEVGKSNIS